jgi:hypothetical protein
MPAIVEATMPEKKLGGEKIPAKNPIAPPKIVDSIPKYGPNIMPTTGAVIAAAVTALPGSPIIGEMAMKPKTAYNAAKQIVKAISLAVIVFLIDMLSWFLPVRLRFGIF